MINNRQKLLHDGTYVRPRRLIIEALEAALSAADPRVCVNKNVKLNGKTLHIMGKRYCLEDFDSIHVIGADNERPCNHTRESQDKVANWQDQALESQSSNS